MLLLAVPAYGHGLRLARAWWFINSSGFWRLSTELISQRHGELTRMRVNSLDMSWDAMHSPWATSLKLAPLSARESMPPGASLPEVVEHLFGQGVAVPEHFPADFKGLFQVSPAAGDVSRLYQEDAQVLSDVAVSGCFSPSTSLRIASPRSR